MGQRRRRHKYFDFSLQPECFVLHFTLTQIHQQSSSSSDQKLQYTTSGSRAFITTFRLNQKATIFSIYTKVEICCATLNMSSIGMTIQRWLCLKLFERTTLPTSDDLAESGSCHICHEPFYKRESPTKLSCGHLVGQGCLIEWVKSKDSIDLETFFQTGKSHTCPICKKPVLREVTAHERNACRVYKQLSESYLCQSEEPWQKDCFEWAREAEQLWQQACEDWIDLLDDSNLDPQETLLHGYVRKIVWLATVDRVVEEIQKTQSFVHTYGLENPEPKSWLDLLKHAERVPERYHKCHIEPDESYYNWLASQYQHLYEYCERKKARAWSQMNEAW